MGQGGGFYHELLQTQGRLAHSQAEEKLVANQRPPRRVRIFAMHVETRAPTGRFYPWDLVNREMFPQARRTPSIT
jgi:hypothetical protein